MTGRSFGFPFAVGGGRTATATGAAAVRGKILQVLFTTPGERVNQPEFGCGLLNLVFEPNDPILAAAVEFTVGQALTRWLGDEIVVDAVDVESSGESVTVAVVWTDRADANRHTVRARLG
jgi:phage baseplate assembly protein W